MKNANAKKNLAANMEVIERAGIVVPFRSKKANKEIEVNLLELPLESLMAVARYGAQRFINDKLGGSEVGEKEAAELFNKILGQLVEGWEGRQRGEGADPIETKARQLAKDQVKAAIMAQGMKLKEVGKEKLAELADKLYEQKADAYKEQAAELIEAEKKAKEKAAEGVDLSSLGL